MYIIDELFSINIIQDKEQRVLYIYYKMSMVKFSQVIKTLSHNVVSCSGVELTTLVVIGTHYIGSCKSQLF
jgi:hypothetical protein